MCIRQVELLLEMGELELGLQKAIGASDVDLLCKAVLHVASERQTQQEALLKLLAAYPEALRLLRVRPHYASSIWVLAEWKMSSFDSLSVSLFPLSVCSRTTGTSCRRRTARRGSTWPWLGGTSSRQAPSWHCRPTSRSDPLHTMPT